jgi:hypothetical protein
VQLEDARHHKAQDIEQNKAMANRDTSPNAQQEFEEVVLPRLKSALHFTSDGPFVDQNCEQSSSDCGQLNPLIS